MRLSLPELGYWETQQGRPPPVPLSCVLPPLSPPPVSSWNPPYPGQIDPGGAGTRVPLISRLRGRPARSAAGRGGGGVGFPAGSVPGANTCPGCDGLTLRRSPAVRGTRAGSRLQPRREAGTKGQAPREGWVEMRSLPPFPSASLRGSNCPWLVRGCHAPPCARSAEIPCPKWTAGRAGSWEGRGARMEQTWAPKGSPASENTSCPCTCLASNPGSDEVTRAEKVAGGQGGLAARARPPD